MPWHGMGDHLGSSDEYEYKTLFTWDDLVVLDVVGCVS